MKKIELYQIGVFPSANGKHTAHLLGVDGNVRDMTFGALSDGVVTCIFHKDLKMLEIVIDKNMTEGFEVDFSMEFATDPSTRTYTGRGTLVCRPDGWDAAQPSGREIDFSGITKQISTGSAS